MSKTTELYTAIIKGIQSQGFRVECTVNNIKAFNPEPNGKMVFSGDIDAAQDWLLTSDFNQGIKSKYPKISCRSCPHQFIPIERPAFHINAIIFCVLSIEAFLLAILLDHNFGTLLVGLLGIWLFIMALFNAAKHFQWERKIS